jgi:hypothetical protein
MKPNYIIVAGDALVIFLLVWVGIRFHQGEPGGRVLFTLLPFAFAWALAAGLLGMLRPLAWRELWRVLPAMLLAAPLGAVLRSAWLGTAALPIFTLVLGGTLAAGLLVWRALFNLVFNRAGK